MKKFFVKKQFTFKTRRESEYTVDKEGHILTEFRGEKISGALDFITKITEFKRIASIDSFIKRIEDCNKRILPILSDESKATKAKLDIKIAEREELKPRHDLAIKHYTIYTKRKSELVNHLIAQGRLNLDVIDRSTLEEEFNNRYPDYLEFHFIEVHKKLTESYRFMNEQINNFTQIRDKIASYNEKIDKYFNDK